jgi:tetratricopeptide (TPR) repeat protein
VRRSAAAVVLVAALAAIALADREIAAFSSQRGDKALAAKKFEEAEGHFRKAIEEDATYLPARHGLAQALCGEGKTAQAVEELRKVVDAARADSALAAEWKAVVAKAEKQLADIDSVGTAFKKIQSTYVDALLDFAQRWSAKDPAAAARAAQQALALRPDDPRAAQLAEKLAPKKGDVTVLFDGASTAGWFFADAPMWTVEDGAVVGNTGANPYVMRTEKTFEGDYTVRCEAKLLTKTGEPAWFALLPCWRGPEDRYALGAMDGLLEWQDKCDKAGVAARGITLGAMPKRPFDPTVWNTFEMRFAGDQVAAFVNGVQVGKEARPDYRRSGFVGLVVANVKAAFRKIEVEPANR